jgi:uncharacterized phage-like protein YoqJ
MIIGITGRRPPEIGGYKLPNPIYISVCKQLEQQFKELKPTKIISGAAQGADQYAGFVANKLNIPVVYAVPFKNQEKFWPENSQKIYHSLLQKAQEIIIVSEGGFSHEKMQIRNKYIVDNCDVLIAVMQEDCVSGGTYNCVEFAKSINRKIIYIRP